jgi:hypothetical protein
MQTPALLVILLAGFTLPAAAEEPIFQDQFKERLAPGWSWVREAPADWRATGEGLEIRIRPGNLWGGANNAQNVLVRPAPVHPPNARPSS